MFNLNIFAKQMKIMNYIRIFILTSFIALACKNDKGARTIVTNEGISTKVFGDSISTEGAISVADALVALKTNDSVLCAVKGYVTSVCQVKGCWMMLSQNANDSTGFFVKFKDYGFFVPKDFSGSLVTVRGVAFKQITPVDELKHYAEDEGKSKEEIEAITTPSEEMKFMADGVIVTPETH